MNPTVSKFCYFSYMVIITLYNSNILLCLHYFLTPQSQTFTNLLIRIFGVSNPTFFMRFLRNYVSIIVGLISNNTVLQCCLLWIFVSIRRLLRFIVCIGVSTPEPWGWFWFCWFVYMCFFGCFLTFLLSWNNFHK